MEISFPWYYSIFILSILFLRKQIILLYQIILIWILFIFIINKAHLLTRRNLFRYRPSPPIGFIIIFEKNVIFLKIRSWCYEITKTRSFSSDVTEISSTGGDVVSLFTIPPHEIKAFLHFNPNNKTQISWPVPTPWAIFYLVTHWYFLLQYL